MCCNNCVGIYFAGTSTTANIDFFQWQQSTVDPPTKCVVHVVESYQTLRAEFLKATKQKQQTYAPPPPMYELRSRTPQKTPPPTLHESTNPNAEVDICKEGVTTPRRTPKKKKQRSPRTPSQPRRRTQLNGAIAKERPITPTPSSSTSLRSSTPSSAKKSTAPRIELTHPHTPVTRAAARRIGIDVNTISDAALDADADKTDSSIPTTAFLTPITPAPSASMSGPLSDIPMAFMIEHREEAM